MRPSRPSWRSRRFGGHGRAPVPRLARTARRPGPGRHEPGSAVLRERDQHGAALRGGADDAVSQGRYRRSCDQRRGHRQPRSAGHQVRLLVQADGRAWRNRRTAAAAAPGGRRARHAIGRGGRARQRVRRRCAAAPGRSRRVLRRAHPGGGQPGRGDGDAAGLRRDAVEQAAVQLRRRRAGSMATRPSRLRRRAGAAGATPGGATSIPSTSCPCRTSGSTRGSPPGTWPSIA